MKFECPVLLQAEIFHAVMTIFLLEQFSIIFSVDTVLFLTKVSANLSEVN